MAVDAEGNAPYGTTRVAEKPFGITAQVRVQRDRSEPTMGRGAVYMGLTDR